MCLSRIERADFFKHTFFACLLDDLSKTKWYFSITFSQVLACRVTLCQCLQLGLHAFHGGVAVPLEKRTKPVSLSPWAWVCYIDRLLKSVIDSPHSWVHNLLLLRKKRWLLYAGPQRRLTDWLKPGQREPFKRETAYLATEGTSGFF